MNRLIVSFVALGLFAVTLTAQDGSIAKEAITWLGNAIETVSLSNNKGQTLTIYLLSAFNLSILFYAGIKLKNNG